MLSAGDRAWVTAGSGDAGPWEVSQLELRALPEPPEEVLAAIEAAAPGLDLHGHTTPAAARGRWGRMRFTRFPAHHVVRVAANEPGTAVTLHVRAVAFDVAPEWPADIRVAAALTIGLAAAVWAVPALWLMAGGLWVWLVALPWVAMVRMWAQARAWRREVWDALGQALERGRRRRIGAGGPYRGAGG